MEFSTHSRSDDTVVAHLGISLLGLDPFAKGNGTKIGPTLPGALQLQKWA